MTSHITVSFGSVAGTGAGLGRTASGRTVIADRPAGEAGGTGIGMSGGELLGAALAGCFWNDLHRAAEGSGIVVGSVDADVNFAGTPARAVRARIVARIGGADEPTLEAVFSATCESSTVANLILAAIPVSFERQPLGGSA